jgi:alpha-galactosidase
MGAHVSAVPNHQVGRRTPLSTRGAVAMSANYGLELDLRALEEGERAEVANQIAFYKRHRRLLQQGRFTRLESPLEGTRVVWMFTDAADPAGAPADSAPVSEAVVVAVRLEARLLAGGGEPERIRIRGLDAAAAYAVEDPFTPGGAQRVSGAELAARGLAVRFPAGDWQAAVRYLRRL